MVKDSQSAMSWTRRTLWRIDVGLKDDDECERVGRTGNTTGKIERARTFLFSFVYVGGDRK